MSTSKLTKAQRAAVASYVAACTAFFAAKAAADASATAANVAAYKVAHSAYLKEWRAMLAVGVTANEAQAFVGDGS